MDLINWKPLADIDSMFGRFNFPKRLMDSSEFEWQPAADISETDTEYLIKADLPNVKRKDIKLNVDNGIITLTGERKHKKEDKDERSLRTESYYGSFTRSFSLPRDVDTKAIKANKDDGVLTVHLPKTEPRKAEALNIKVS